MDKICKNCEWWRGISLDINIPDKSTGKCNSKFIGIPLIEYTHLEFGCNRFSLNKNSKICKNCKHWDAQPGPGAPAPLNNTCIHPKIIPDEDTEEYLPDARDMVVIGNTDNFPWIETGPDFGCIHFEAK